jgi:hypothetical protein
MSEEHSDIQKKKEECDRRCQLVQHLKLEVICAKLVFLFCLGIVLLLLLSQIVGCGHVRLPNRDHPNCNIPHTQRPVCISNADCAQDFLCAKRGSEIGRCTYIDCCDPWRNRRLEKGDSFCEGSDIRKPVFNGPTSP